MNQVLSLHGRSSDEENRLRRLWMKLRDDFSQAALGDKNWRTKSKIPRGFGTIRAIPTAKSVRVSKRKNSAFPIPSGAAEKVAGVGLEKNPGWSGNRP
jgi:hypothetical protein